MLGPDDARGGFTVREPSDATGVGDVTHPDKTAQLSKTPAFSLLDILRRRIFIEHALSAWADARAVIKPQVGDHHTLQRLPIRRLVFWASACSIGP